ERNLHLVPEFLSNDEAVFVEPLSAACEILDQVDIPEGAQVAVLGDGKLGLLISQVLHANRIRPHLYGRHQEKLQIAKTAGIETASLEKKIPTAAYDWIIEATGSRYGLDQAVRMVRPRGTLIMKSTIHGSAFINTASVIVDEVTLIGSRCGRFE